MNATEFENKAKLSQPLADYLDGIGQESGDDQRTIGVDLLFVFAAHALYVYARNYLDHQRALNQAELHTKMLDHLLSEGYDRDKALAAASEMSKAFETHPPDDSVLKAAIGLISNS
jgi:hypothetical protein